MSDEQDDSRPHLRVVSERSEQELEQEMARSEIGYPLRNLAANMLRVVRGAGAPYYVGRQCAAVIAAFEQYRAAFGHYPRTHEIQEALQLETPHPEDSEGEWARHELMRGGLRLAAANILGQRLQIAHGERDMTNALSQYERWQESNRRMRDLARKIQESRNRGRKKDKEPGPKI